jgi:hypothetical protein
MPRYTQEDFERDLADVEQLRHHTRVFYLDGTINCFTHEAMQQELDCQERKIRGKWGAICGNAAKRPMLKRWAERIGCKP